MEKYWSYVEKIIRYVLNQIVHISDESKVNAITQLVKFVIVGAGNNLVYYGVYLLLIRIDTDYIIANTLAFTISVFNAYYWNNKYVFQSETRRVWWKTLLKTYISYSGTGIILSNILLYLWVGILGVPMIIAPIIDLAITVPINFLINKLWAFN